MRYRHDVVEDEVRRYLSEAGLEAAAILEAQLTGNPELLKPYEQKHLHNVIRSGEALDQMMRYVAKQKGGMSLVERLAGSPRTVDPPKTLDEFHDALKDY